MGETRSAPVAAAVVGSVAVAPLTWWLTLELFADDVDPEGADFMIEPANISSGTRLTIGLVALAVVVGELAVFVSGLFAGRIRRQWVGVLVPIATFFAYVGLTYRVATAPTTGANIGGALLLMGALIVVPVLGVVALIYALRLRPERPPPRRRGMAL